IAEVEEILVGKPHQQLVQDGEPANAGIEDADGTRAVIPTRTPTLASAPTKRCATAAVCGTGERTRHAGHHSRALRSGGAARGGGIEHASRSGPPGARAVRARPGAGPARVGRPRRGPLRVPAGRESAA